MILSASKGLLKHEPALPKGPSKNKRDDCERRCLPAGCVAAPRNITSIPSSQRLTSGAPRRSRRSVYLWTDPKLFVILVLVLCATHLPGCSSGLGDFCYHDGDCTSGLRCTAREDQRGICIYPEGIPDQMTAVDLGRDARVDRSPLVDLSTPDGAADAGDAEVSSDHGMPDILTDAQPDPDVLSDAALDLTGLDAMSNDQSTDGMVDSAPEE